MEGTFGEEGGDFGIGDLGDEDGLDGGGEEGGEAARGVFEADDGVTWVGELVEGFEIAFRMGFGMGVIFARDPVGDFFEEGILLADSLNLIEWGMRADAHFGIFLFENRENTLDAGHEVGSAFGIESEHGVTFFGIKSSPVVGLKRRKFGEEPFT